MANTFIIQIPKIWGQRLYFLKYKSIRHYICFWDKSWCQSTKILRDCYKFGARLVLWEGQPFSRIKKNMDYPCMLCVEREITPSQMVNKTEPYTVISKHVKSEEFQLKI